MIYCLWYPSGGFGHFISAVLSLYGKNFARPRNKKIKFSKTGNAHELDLAAPKYQNNCNYSFDFDPGLNYSVLVDNGINDESLHFQKFFPTATIIKICYSDRSWPIVARTMIDKAMWSNLDQALQIDTDKWNLSADWVKREKYFLFLRDHHLRNSWKSSNFNSILVDNMLTYNSLYDTISNSGIELEDFEADWNKWQQANCLYLDPVHKSLIAIEHIKNNINLPLNNIDDLWSQAVLYYFIWIEFNKEVPHNDYADFFLDTNSIRRWLSL